MDPFVSIIIPTYNRAPKISLTIDSLLRQSYPSNKVEIIVVDNNSTDNTRPVVQEIINENKGRVSYLFEVRQGVHYARNTAAKKSKGEILYFTDDDMVADENAIANIVKVFDLGCSIGTATGKVSPKWECPPPKWVLDYFNNYLLSINDPKEKLIISESDCGIFSCHQAVLRDVFFKSGGFNPENTAGEWIGDGETGLNIKIAKLGYKFACTAESITWHMIPSARMTQSYINKRLGNQGNSDSYTYYRQNRPAKNQIEKMIVSHWKNYIKTIVRYTIRRLLRDEAYRVALAYSHYYKSRIAYDKRLINNEQWRQLVLKDNWLDD